MGDSNKYQNGKIYKIVDIGYNKCYYGSTIQPLSVRMAGHRRTYKVYKDGKHHKVTVYDMFDEYGVENCKIELVEACPCNSKEELESKEGSYIKNNACVNRITNGRTQKQYREENRERLSELDKVYKQNNRERYKEQKKTYYNANRNEFIEQAKLYRLENKDKIKEFKKQKYDTNKEKILEHRKEKITCSVCGSCVRKSDKAKHERSQKHQQALTKPDELENYDETII